MISWIFATIISFCPVTTSADICGYVVHARAISIYDAHIVTFNGYPTDGTCVIEPGPLGTGPDNGGCWQNQTPPFLQCRAPDFFTNLSAAADPNGHFISIQDEPPDTFVIFKVQPLSCSQNTYGCDTWWDISTDPNAPCVCPNGEC